MPELIGNDVIIERIHGLTKLIESKFDENKKEHTTICEKQDHTNGDVSNLKLWQARLIGAWAVISIILVGMIIPLVNYYLQNKIK